MIRNWCETIAFWVVIGPLMLLAAFFPTAWTRSGYGSPFAIWAPIGFGPSEAV